MLVWLSLAVSLAAVAGGIVFAATRGLALWRQFRSTTRAVGGELARIAASADAVAGSVEGMGGASEELDASLARLSASRARLHVLQEAWSDVSAAFGGVSSYLPREKKA